MIGETPGITSGMELSHSIIFTVLYEFMEHGARSMEQCDGFPVTSLVSRSKMAGGQGKLFAAHNTPQTCNYLDRA